VGDKIQVHALVVSEGIVFPERDPEWARTEAASGRARSKPCAEDGVGKRGKYGLRTKGNPSSQAECGYKGDKKH